MMNHYIQDGQHDPTVKKLVNITSYRTISRFLKNKVKFKVSNKANTQADQFKFILKEYNSHL